MTGWWKRLNTPLTEADRDHCPCCDCSSAWHQGLAEGYRDQARTALAAMPQPIGTAVTWTAHGERHFRESGFAEETLSELSAHLLCIDPCCQAAVVALVPVGGDDA